MNHEISRLREQQAAEAKTAREERGQEREFARTEELFQYDSSQNPVPPEVAERVNESISREERPRQNWWRRIFGAPN